MENDESIELSFAAKAALKKYLLSMLVLPSAALTVLGFVLGFGINEAARSTAYSNAYSDSSTMILEMAAKTGAASSSAQESNERIQLVVEHVETEFAAIEKARLSAEEAIVKINNFDAFTEASNKIDEIADSVIRKSDIVNTVMEKVGARIEALEKENSKTRNPEQEGQLISLPGGSPRGAWQGTTYCPNNHYVCGIDQRVEQNKGSAGDDTGVNAVTMTCCPF